jgi:hypothetical protein
MWSRIQSRREERYMTNRNWSYWGSWLIHLGLESLLRKVDMNGRC